MTKTANGRKIAKKRFISDRELMAVSWQLKSLLESLLKAYPITADRSKFSETSLSGINRLLIISCRLFKLEFH
jgi:hypothetical protein